MTEPWHTALAIAGLALVTLLTRSFFLLGERDIPLPRWLQQGLRFAPLAALVAVVAPELVLVDGRLIDSWQEPRLFAAAAAAAYWFRRRGMLGTIVTGGVVLTILRWGLGW